jgi:hypothetical protein
MTPQCDARAQTTKPIADVEADSRRVSRWMAILYLATALAAPLVLYFGPDVLSPTAPAIANAALDGRFTVHRHAACNATSAANARARASNRC